MIAAAELQIEPIVGWRFWRVAPWTTVSGDREPRLVALGGLAWPPGRALEAMCLDTHQHDAPHLQHACGVPHLQHACGVYAFRTEEEARELLRAGRLLPEHEVRDYAIGRVSLWGRVVEHERGWRTQFAYPYALSVSADEKTARRLRDLYAVDVECEQPAPPVKAKGRSRSRRSRDSTG